MLVLSYALYWLDCYKKLHLVSAARALMLSFIAPIRKAIRPVRVYGRDMNDLL